MIRLDAGVPANSYVHSETGARMIPVELEPGQIGAMAEDLLFKRWGIDEDDHAQVQWIEYWLEAPGHDTPPEKRVHRSAHVFVKKPLSFEGVEGNVNG